MMIEKLDSDQVIKHCTRFLGYHYPTPPAQRLIAVALEVAHETGIWLFGSLTPSQLPAYHKLELTIGDATLDLAGAEIGELFRALFRKAEAEHS